MLVTHFVYTKDPLWERACSRMGPTQSQVENKATRQHGRAAVQRSYCAGCAAFIFSAIFASTAARIWSTLKLAGFWIGGYSMNVCRNCADLVTATATR